MHTPCTRHPSCASLHGDHHQLSLVPAQAFSPVSGCIWPQGLRLASLLSLQAPLSLKVWPSSERIMDLRSVCLFFRLKGGNHAPSGFLLLRAEAEGLSDERFFFVFLKVMNACKVLLNTFSASVEMHSFLLFKRRRKEEKKRKKEKIT